MMKLLKTDEATKATAAIYNAAKNIAKTSSANLRLSNLERSVRKHEQKSNEFFKRISNPTQPQKTRKDAIQRSQWPLLNNRLPTETTSES